MALDSREVAVAPGLSARLLDGGRRFLEGDVFYSFRRSPMTMVAFAVTIALFLIALLAPLLAPYDTLDLS